MSYTNYHGWKIRQGPVHPITGRWRATRFGVHIGAGTKDALLSMIDARYKAERERDRRSV